jgi:hypothetical protein
LVQTRTSGGLSADSSSTSQSRASGRTSSTEPMRSRSADTLMSVFSRRGRATAASALATPMSSSV